MFWRKLICLMEEKQDIENIEKEADIIVTDTTKLVAVYSLKHKGILQVLPMK